MALPPTASTLMPSSIGSLASTICDIDISASRYDLHNNQVYSRPPSVIEEEDRADTSEGELLHDGIEIHTSESGYYCRACLESLESLWEARQHVQLQTHKDAMQAFIDMSSDDDSDDDDDPYGPRGRSPERSESRGSIMSEIPTSSRPSRPTFPPPPSYSSFGSTTTSRVSLTPRQDSRPLRVRLTPASRSDTAMSSMSSDFASFGGVDTPPTSRHSCEPITDAHYGRQSFSDSPRPPSYRFLGSIHTDRSIGRTPEEFLASRGRLAPNSSSLRRRESCQAWRYGDEGEQRLWRAEKRGREYDNERAVELKAKIPKQTPVYDAEVYHGQPREKYSGEWCEEAGCWVTEVQPICVVLAGMVIAEQPDEEIVVLETSVRCEICKLYIDTQNMSENEITKIKYDHRSDPAHLIRREKMRKRFGICEAFNREIEKIKGHRIKLGLTANGRPRHFWCTCCDAHLKSPEAVHFHIGINAHRSNLEYHDWCYEVGQDPRLYYNSGWHFPVKDERKKEGKVLPKLDEMKLEDISYLTKGEAAGANYCCRCNVTLTSPWDIQKHLQTKTHQERSAVGQRVDERPPLIELEADILFTKEPTEEEKEETKAEVKIEDELPPDPLSNEEREIAEVWGDEEEPRSHAADFDKMVAAIINGENIEKCYKCCEDE